MSGTAGAAWSGRAVHVGLDVVPQSGGTTTAIGDFRRALGGRVVSFTAPALVPAGAPDHVLHVPTTPGALGRLYGLAAGAPLERARAALADADLVLVHGLFRYHAQWATRHARALGTPLWVVPHGGLDPYVFTYRAWQKRPWMAAVGRPMIARAAAVVFATGRERAKALPYTADARAAVVAWPTDPVDVAARDAARPRARARLGVPDDARLLLFVGRLHPLKRVLETIRLVAEIDDPRLHLAVVGPATSEIGEAECRGLAASLGASHRVHVAGPLYGAEKSEAMLASDGFVSLSGKENFGYTVAEAMAHGLPLVLSPEIDLAHDVAGSAGRVGWLLRSSDPAEAARAVREFAAAPAALLAELGARALAWARDRLAPDRFGVELRRLAHETAGPRDPR